jgi:hypothetical protein
MTFDQTMREWRRGEDDRWRWFRMMLAFILGAAYG